MTGLAGVLQELVEGELGKARSWETAYKDLHQTCQDVQNNIKWAESQASAQAPAKVRATPAGAVS